MTGLSQHFIAFRHNPLMWNQYSSTRIDFRYTPGDFLVPGPNDGLGRTFQAHDQAVNEFTTFLRRKLQGLAFNFF